MAAPHFSAAIIRRFDPDTGCEEHLLVNSSPKSSRSTVQVKYPGGNAKPGEDPFETVRREIKEETGLHIRRRYHIKSVVKQPVALDHTQYFFFIEFSDCRGKLRESELKEESSVLSKPYWEPIATIYDKLFPTHRSAFLKMMITNRRLSELRLKKRRYRRRNRDKRSCGLHGI